MSANGKRSWQRRRSAFNHDWLKNRFLPALAKCLNLLDGKIDDPEFAGVFLRDTLPQWQDQRQEAAALARDCEQAMSPALLFDRPPLADCDEPWLPALRKLVHNLWLVRYAVRQGCNDVCAATADADRAYRQLRQRLDDTIPPVAALRLLRTEFAAFRDACQRLARAVEALPAEVKVT